ncbi:MAG: matrixin family metalloprotease, partial [Rhodospirillales bacterium]
GVPADPVAVVPSAVDMAALYGLVPGSVDPPRDGSPEVDPGDAAAFALLADLAGGPDDETPLVPAWQDPAGEATAPSLDSPAIAATGGASVAHGGTASTFFDPGRLEATGHEPTALLEGTTLERAGAAEGRGLFAHSDGPPEGAGASIIPTAASSLESGVTDLESLSPVNSIDAEASPFVLAGGKFGPSGTLGTTGGVVSWSIMPGGITLAPSVGSGLVTVGMSTFLNFDFEAQLRLGFDAWSAVANIEFIQVPDGGGQLGTEAFGEIRIGGGFLDGPGSILALTFNMGQGPVSGDQLFDSGESGFWTEHSFFVVGAHEIGHSIGLGHETVNLALMNPFFNGALNGLQQDDINGARAIYGAQDFGTNTYNLPSSEANLDILDAPPNPVINGNFLGNTINGSSAGEAINGLSGNDVINGNGGADTLTGGDGTDTLTGGAGGDSLDGGTGFDIAGYSGFFGDYDITDSAGVFTITDLNGVDGDDGTDTFQNVEQLLFADQSVLVSDLINQSPVVVAISETTNEDAAPLAIDLLAGASDPDPGDALSLTGVVQTGGPAAAFTVSGGVLGLDPGQFNTLLAGQSAVLTFDYGVTDQTATSNETVTITVDGRNDAPTGLLVSAAGVAENAAFSATLTTLDPDIGDSFTYSLTGDPTAGAFQIAGDQLSLVAPLDFEALPAGFTDQGDGTATVTLGLSADDGVNAPFAKNLVFTVNDANDNAPTDLQAAAASFDENAAFAATLSATDPDSAAVNSFTYTLTNDPTGGAFQIAGDQLSLVAPLDFEALPAGFADQGDGTANVDLEVTVFDEAGPTSQVVEVRVVRGIDDAEERPDTAMYRT